MDHMVQQVAGWRGGATIWYLVTLGLNMNKKNSVLDLDVVCR